MFLLLTWGTSLRSSQIYEVHRFGFACAYRVVSLCNVRLKMHCLWKIQASDLVFFNKT
jgi:hypothetical protein